MPNNKNERKGKQTGELSAEERFRNFFSTSVIDLPEEMTHRDEPAPVEEKPKAGLLGKLFGHDKEETPAAAQPVLEIPTGEILLGADAKPVQPEQEDMALELRTADPVPVMPLQFARTEPVPKAAQGEERPGDTAATGGAGAAGDAAAEGYAQRHERQGKACRAAGKARAGSAAAQGAACACTACGRAGKSPGKGCTTGRRGTAAGGVCQRSGRPGNAAEKA